MITDLTQYLLSLRGWPILVAVFALPLLESSAFIGFVFPGEIAVLLGGALAAQHQTHLAAVLLAAACGAVFGDAIGYSIGRRWGRQWVDGTLGRFVPRAHVERGERYLAQRGGKAVLFGRFAAALRVVMPGLAGMARMPYRTFAVYNVIGGVIWAITVGVLGYLAGASWPYVAYLASRTGLIVITLLAAGVAGSLVVRTIRRHPHWLATTRLASWLRRRFPALMSWLNRRLDPHKQSGLRLTAVVLVAVGSAWLFAGLTQDVLAREEFAQADSVVNAAVVSHRVPWVSTTMLVVTWLGSAAVLVPVILLTTVYLTYIKPDVLSIVRLWLAYLGAAGLSELMKFLVNRPRPPNAERLMSVSDTAFPSSHATQVLAVWGTLAFLLMRRQRKRIRVTAFLGVVAVSLLVGFSRLYLGVHWLTDVVGGYALGAMWLAIVLIAGITASRALGQRR